MCVDKRWSRLNRGFSQVNVQLFPEILSRNVQQETIVSKISYISATHKKNKITSLKNLGAATCKLVNFVNHEVQSPLEVLKKSFRSPSEVLQKSFRSPWGVLQKFFRSPAAVSCSAAVASVTYIIHTYGQTFGLLGLLSQQKMPNQRPIFESLNFEIGIMPFIRPL